MKMPWGQRVMGALQVVCLGGRCIGNVGCEQQLIPCRRRAFIRGPKILDKLWSNTRSLLCIQYARVVRFVVKHNHSERMPSTRQDVLVCVFGQKLGKRQKMVVFFRYDEDDRLAILYGFDYTATSTSQVSVGVHPRFARKNVLGLRNENSIRVLGPRCVNVASVKLVKKPLVRLQPQRHASSSENNQNIDVPIQQQRRDSQHARCLSGLHGSHHHSRDNALPLRSVSAKRVFGGKRREGALDNILRIVLDY